MTGGSGQERAINPAERRPRNLAAQDLKLMPQHHQLDVLDVRAASTAHKQAEQRTESEVGEGEEHEPILPGCAQRGRDRSNGTLQGCVKYDLAANGHFRTADEFTHPTGLLAPDLLETLVADPEVVSNLVEHNAPDLLA